MAGDLSVAIAGSVSAACSTISVYPLDTLKTYLNKGTDEDGNTVSSFSQLLRRLIRKYGYTLQLLRVLYAGIGTKILMSMTQKFLYFYVYNWLLRRATNGSKKISVFRNLLVGYVSAITAVAILTPFEIAQTRQQISPKDGKSVRTFLREIAQSEGIRGLYRGFETNLILCVNPAIEFTAFERIKRVFLSRNAASDTPHLNDGQAFFVGATAKAIATILTFPHVRVKVLQQAGVGKYDGMDTNSVLVSLLVTDGIGSWFKGMKTQLVKNVIASAIMMATKERIERTVIDTMAK